MGFGFLGCEEESSPVSESKSQIIKEIEISDELSLAIESMLHSNPNCIIASSLTDTVWIIKSQSDLADFTTCTPSLSIDFEKHMLLVASINSPSISDSIANTSLTLQSDLLIYKVVLKRCSECWNSLGKHWTWGVFPKSETQKVSLDLKTE